MCIPPFWPFGAQFGKSLQDLAHLEAFRCLLSPYLIIEEPFLPILNQFWKTLSLECFFICYIWVYDLKSDINGIQYVKHESCICPPHSLKPEFCDLWSPCKCQNSLIEYVLKSPKGS